MTRRRRPTTLGDLLLTSLLTAATIFAAVAATALLRAAELFGVIGK